MALDNVEARSYINSICMSLDILLVEAGTAGYDGQARLIKRGNGRCYDCELRSPSKQYPVCTIRTFPEKPIHCIIWAKELLSTLFGENNEDTSISELLHKIESFSNEDFSLEIAKYLFVQLIEEQRVSESEKFKNSRVLDIGKFAKNGNHNESSNTEKFKTSLHSEEIYFSLFINSCKKLREIFQSKGILVFDKDDEDHINFISSASNLRALNFNIELKTVFEIKEMAGNIVPAICSTNSIAAGIQVLLALRKYYNELIGKTNDFSLYKVNYIQNFNEKKIINSTESRNPNVFIEINQCLHCAQENIPTIYSIDFGNLTIKEILVQILGENLDFYTIELESKVIFEGGDDLDDDEIEYYSRNLAKMLSLWNKKDLGFQITKNFSSNQFCRFFLTQDVNQKKLEIINCQPLKFISLDLLTLAYKGKEEMKTDSSPHKENESKTITIEEDIEFLEDQSKKRPLESNGNSTQKRLK